MSDVKVEETQEHVVDVKVEEEKKEKLEEKEETAVLLKNESIEKDNNEPICDDETMAEAIDAADRMDELTSLEREIAQMHQPTAPVVAQRVDVGEASGDVDDVINGDKVLLEMQPASRNSTPATQEDATAVGALLDVAPLTVESGDDDLIAVLKGLDRASEDDVKESDAPQHNDALLDADLVEGVTIEGEGEFQIMEVVDDEADETAELVANSPKPKSGILETYKTSTTCVNKPAAKLTREEERAMAMEQMAGLQSRVDRQRRRKQDIRTLNPLESSDLVNAINAEWSDDEIVSAAEYKLAATTTITTAATTATTVMPEEQRTASSSSSSPPKHTNGKVKSTTPKTVPSVTEESTTTAEGGGVAEVPAAASNQQSSGFKRTRIIKRKIIWDPDAPETRISYSQLVRGTNKTKSGDTATGGGAAAKSSSAQTSNATQSTPHATKKTRPNTPKEQTVQSTKSSSDDGATEATSPTKRRSHTPVVVNGGGGAANSVAAKKKKISEVDRLMGDEGAVNMLNSLESERIKLEGELENDKPHRPLMRSRAATISERRDILPAIVPKKDATPNGPKNKRAAKQKPSSTWDYVYKQQASEDAMIIRRRSNSSYSSTASQHRLSLDAPINTSKSTPNKAAAAAATPTTTATTPATSNSNLSNDEATKATARGKSASKPTDADSATADMSALALAVGKSFEFAKPESKSKTNRRSKDAVQVQAAANSSPSAAELSGSGNKKTTHAGAVKPRSSATRSPATVDEKLDKVNKSPTTVKESGASTADVVIKKSAKVAQIIFNTQKAKLSYTFTAPLLNKLAEALEKLGKDADCHAVVMITNAPHFCQGLDITELTTGSTADKRKAAAIQLAAAAKNYIKTLATFPKPLIAGVNGSNIGLGVTQLPLFDIVVASDKSSYETPYARIGQVPEGYCIWQNLTKIRGTLKTKLFWLSEKLQSSESALCGLVNKLTATNRVNDDAILLAKKIAACSPEMYRVMKSHTIKNHLDAIVSSLDDEFDTIVKQWTSAECLEHFKKFLELGHF